MPPTPFHPTHQTPFKSTVSTSQQSRVHHTPFGGASSLSISVADIDPSEWRYHAEGGKNVLLSFAPASRSDGSPFATSMCTFALRIPKHLPGQEEEDEEEAEEFATGVITPLLGNPSVLPRCIRIPISTPRDRDIIETLAARIEMHRPATRRSHSARIRSERLTCIYAVEDVTAPLLVGGSSPVLCVEIKPKWGFLPRIKNLPPGSPNVEIKGRFSRYRMHRVTRAAAEGGRMTKEQFEALYDPLDLYSRDAGRKGRAVKALYRDWRETNGQTNNLRLFWNGELVKPDDSTTLNAVAEFLGVNAENLVEGLTQHIVQELSRPLPASLEGQDVLSKLSHLQSALDPLDVEGLAHLWLARTQSHTLGESPSDLPPSLTTPLPASQLLPVPQNFLTNKEVGLEEALQAFLVSATFKDCSLLLRFEGGGEAKVEGATKLVDLDRKAWNKLGKMQETDAEVCAAFLGWLESVGGEVA